MKGPLEHLAGWTLGRIGRHLWGFAPALMPRIVERLGPVSALRWMARNMPEYERCLKQMGPLRCHLACVVASLTNGCAYCSYGHARPLLLHYFRERGALFPVDEHGLIALSHLEDQEMRARLEQLLEAAGMSQEIPMVRRIHALQLEGASPESDEDRRLLHLIRMFDVLNSCGLDWLVPFDDTHDPIHRDAELKARHAQARLEAARAQQELAKPDGALGS